RPLVESLDGLALALAQQPDFERAEECAHQAVVTAQRREHRLLEAMATLTVGAIQFLRGRAEALATLSQATEALTGMQAGWQMTRAHTWLAQAHFRLGTESAAFDHLRMALQVAETIGSDATFDLHVRWDAGLFQAARAAGVEAQRMQSLLARVADTPFTPVATQTVRPRLVEAYGFGLGTVAIDGSNMAVWRRDKSRELLFVLLNRGAQRYDQLIEALWPDAPPARAHASLHTVVSHLRHAV